MSGRSTRDIPRLDPESAERLRLEIEADRVGSENARRQEELASFRGARGLRTTFVSEQWRNLGGPDPDLQSSDGECAPGPPGELVDPTQSWSWEGEILDPDVAPQRAENEDGAPFKEGVWHRLPDEREGFRRVERPEVWHTLEDESEADWDGLSSSSESEQDDFEQLFKKKLDDPP
jgi:hypothetical protein